ncbi:hypothetical protein F5984_25390 [Rudanella paleaurantiibacter]|uniref:Protein kinase domain-containing protein n=1 Tax=Rudanella paleaurantiibacter TaxID=2614655 RepID=A0A7J5TS46_9BACT|nr:WG repeat-containing protein [Rudanella paleaurantiibacter]KAB7725994.1 hypothetical protein F5984_25390 [Rudanella paleaurantiibacter]
MFANTDLIEAVANRHFSSLTHMEPVWDEQYDEPWYSTGKMGIVFKLADPETGQRFALKVFKERDTEREERLRQLAEQLAAYPSPYWVSYRFLPDELRIESTFGEAERACVLLMDWIEGQTLGQFVRDACQQHDRATLYKLTYAFDQMALWLLANPFAHGDLKHDNILIRPNGVPALVDYDGMFFPVFTNLKALELGTPDYQHPKRNLNHYGPYLDDFSLLVISLSLYALAHHPSLYAEYNTGENLILTQTNFEQPRQSALLSTLQELDVPGLRQRLALLDYALALPPQSVPGLDVLLKDKFTHYATLQTLTYPPTPDLIPYRKGNKWGFCDRNKKIVIECVYDDAGPFEEVLARVKQGGKYGFIDQTGKQVVPFQYEYASHFSEGLAKVKQYRQWGFVDKMGRLVIRDRFDDACDFSEGMAKVKQYGKWGFIDRTGQLVIPYQFEDVSSFSDSLARMQQYRYGGYGYINKTGQLVIPCQFVLAWRFSEGMASVRLHEKLDLKWGFIDKTGQLVIPCQFNNAGYFSEGLARVEEYRKYGFDTKYGFINNTGELVIPYQFSHAGDFSEGLAWVQKEGQYGFINKVGQLIIPYKFGGASNYSNGLARVGRHLKVGYIDREGNQYWEEEESQEAEPSSFGMSLPPFVSQFALEFKPPVGTRQVS